MLEQVERYSLVEPISCNQVFLSVSQQRLPQPSFEADDIDVMSDQLMQQSLVIVLKGKGIRGT